ncbi:hypothetical protein ABEB36_000412 [Hypothenemus hampei]|uniref:CCHC-type domain-containing protein n=1 Tax=Hypothenemus hampei TaxID=57062 RepID=A0ABD1FD22_HYPHA
MANTQQKKFLAIHIKNKLKGGSAQLISSRNPNSYLEIKQLLNLHFGDSRDFPSLIKDLQRLRQIAEESPLTLYNRLHVLNAKLHAHIQKSPSLRTKEQKDAQTTLIETMALNTLLTGLEPRLGQLIRARNPSTLLEAQTRILRELQLSYLENQKAIEPSFQSFQSSRNQSFRYQNNQSNRSQQQMKCSNCGRLGHTHSHCRQVLNQQNVGQNSFRPNFYYSNNPQGSSISINSSNFQQQNRFNNSAFRFSKPQNQQLQLLLTQGIILISSHHRECIMSFPTIILKTLLAKNLMRVMIITIP